MHLNVVSSRSINVGDEAAPPIRIVRRLDVSYLPNSGHASSAFAIVGTMLISVALCFSINCRTDTGSNRRTITCFEPRNVENCGRPQPLAWNSGIVCRSTMLSASGHVHAAYSACKYSDRCDNATPFGVPVEPLV